MDRNRPMDPNTGFRDTSNTHTTCDGGASHCNKERTVCLINCAGYQNS